MKKCMIFPHDLNTLEIINEIEAYLGLPHKKIDEMSNFKLHEYINQLTFRLIMEESIHVNMIKNQ